MNGQVGWEVTNGVAVVTLDNPPLNALGHDLRAGLAEAVDRAINDPGIAIVVLRAAGRSWPVGADIREFGKPPLAPALPDLCTRIAAAPKPVIAALHGSALGGGLELALVAAFRVAAADLKLGLPEITLGLLPGAGGTQRLPRLIGAAAALDLILSGAPIDAARGHRLGLVDLVAPASADGPAAAFALAMKLAEDHVSGRRRLPAASDRPTGVRAEAGPYLDAVQAARARRFAAHERAAPRIIDCVEAALLLPEAHGLAIERAAFLDLVATPEARALRHAFLSERRGAKSLPAVAAVGGQPPRHVALAGGCRMAAGLTGALISAGLRVTLIGDDSAGLARVLTRLAKSEDAAVANGEKSDVARKAAWDRIAARPGDVPAALQAALQEHGPVDLLVECGPPDESADLAARQNYLATLSEGLAPATPVLSLLTPAGAAILAPDPLALAPDARDRLAVLAMTAPFRKMALAEAALTDRAASGEAGMALQVFLRALGWRGLRHGPVAGFLGPRLATAMADAADRCLTAGAEPHEVDVALRQAGMPSGPFEGADLAGADDWLRSDPVRRDGVGEDPVARQLRDALATDGRTGRRAGRGWHDHPASGPWKPSAEVIALASGLRPRARIGAATIWRRVLAGIANDAVWALAEGRARQPSDIDLVALAQGFPRWRGGPMQAADEAGLLGLRDDLRGWAEASGDAFWTPAPLWDELIREGRHFSDLNAG